MAGLTATVLTAALALGMQSGTGSGPRRERAGERQPASSPARRSASQQIGELQNSVKLLEAELRSLRREMSRERTDAVSAADLQRLNLLEQREERLEDRLDYARNRLRNAQARETDLQRRLDNIDSERIVYGGINREDSERAVRNYLDREIVRAREEVAGAEREVSRLEVELDRARAAAEALRRKLRLTPEDIEAEQESEGTGTEDQGEEVISIGGQRIEPQTELETDAPDEKTTLAPVPDTRRPPR